MRLYRRPVIGLALSGGGARGLAHIGALKVLERENVPVDCLSGASMGGIIAATYAAGLSAADLEAEALRLTRPRHLLKLLDWSIPRHGLLTGSGVRSFLAEKLGEKLTFEDLSKPLGLTAVDLVSGAELVLREGPVVDAVRATAGFPAVFEPVKMGDYRLVDGGVLNNIPVDVARQLGAEVVIALDVRMDFYDLALVDNPETPFAARVAHNAWRAESLMAGVLDGLRLKSSPPDLVIHPRLPGDVSAFSGFARAAEIIATGEQATEEALGRIHKLARPRLFLRPAAASVQAKR